MSWKPSELKELQLGFCFGEEYSRNEEVESLEKRIEKPSEENTRRSDFTEHSESLKTQEEGQTQITAWIA